MQRVPRQRERRMPRCPETGEIFQGCAAFHLQHFHMSAATIEQENRLKLSSEIKLLAAIDLVATVYFETKAVLPPPPPPKTERVSV